MTDPLIIIRHHQKGVPKTPSNREPHSYGTELGRGHMRIVSFDLSLSATGWCVAGAAVEWGVFKPPNVRGGERVDWIARQCSGWVKAAELVVMEDFSFSSNMQGTREIAGVAYMVRHWLWRHSIPYVLVAPASPKKFIVGHGGSKNNPVTKSIVIKEVWKRWDHDTCDDNAADAIGLCYIGRALTGERPASTDAQRVVIDALAKKYPDLPM